MAKSDLEDKFLRIIEDEQRRNGIRLAYPEREFRFHPRRKWRFDFAWPQILVAVEVEGGVWTGGRHSGGAGMAADCDKYNAAVALGWKVLRFTEKQLREADKVFELVLMAMCALDGEEV